MPPQSSSSNNNNNSATTTRLPSNAVVVADIGLHTTKSGIILGTPGLGFDENNITSSTSANSKGSNSVGNSKNSKNNQNGNTGKNGAGNVKQAAQMMLDSALGNNNNSSNNNNSQENSSSGLDATVVMKRTFGLDIDYTVVNPDLVVKNCLSSLPGFASFFGDSLISPENENNNNNNDDDVDHQPDQDLSSVLTHEDRTSFYSRRKETMSKKKNVNFIANNGKNNFEDAASAYFENFELPGCVALFVPFGMRRLCIEKILEAMFEGPAPPRVFLGCSSLQALTSIGLTSGTVVDVGQFETRILPATDGSCHRAFALRNQRLGAAYQSLASVSSLLMSTMAHQQGSDSNNNDSHMMMIQQQQQQQQQTLSALSENILSRPYMRNNNNNDHQSILASVGDLCDDVVRIFALSVMNNNNGNNNNTDSSSFSLQQDDATNNNNNISKTSSTLPDGEKLSFFSQNSNNNHNASSFLPLNSVLALQDSYCDYLFNPSSFYSALKKNGSSTPLFSCLTQTLFSSSSCPAMNLTDSLKLVLRNIASENNGNHNSTMFKSACSNIVLCGGGSVLPSVESNFARTVESSKFASSCILGGPVNLPSSTDNNLTQDMIKEYSFFSSQHHQQNNTSTNANNLFGNNKNHAKKDNNSKNNTNGSSLNASRPIYKTLRDRINANWSGGSLLMQAGSVVDVTVSSSSFFEEGPHACAHVYGVGGWRS